MKNIKEYAPKRTGLEPIPGTADSEDLTPPRKGHLSVVGGVTRPQTNEKNAPEPLVRHDYASEFDSLSEYERANRNLLTYLSGLARKGEPVIIKDENSLTGHYGVQSYEESDEQSFVRNAIRVPVTLQESGQTLSGIMYFQSGPKPYTEEEAARIIITPADGGANKIYRIHDDYSEQAKGSEDGLKPVSELSINELRELQAAIAPAAPGEATT